jgi:hypothetical protein
MVASAALQLAWSRYLSDQAAATGDTELALAASRLADASRNNLLSAHELAAREAVARRASQPTSAHATLTAVLGADPAPLAPALPAPLTLDHDAPPVADVPPAAMLPARVVVGGGPRVGKTMLARRLATDGRPVRETDEAIDLGWSGASEHVATWLDAPGPWIVEGVAVARALRKWLASHPEGRPCDLLLWSSVPRSDRTPGQVTMGKGCETVLAEIRGELTRRGVRVEGFPA